MVEILAVNSSEATLYFKVLTWKTWLSLLFMIDVLSFFMADSSVDLIVTQCIGTYFGIIPRFDCRAPPYDYFRLCKEMLELLVTVWKG